MMQETQTLETGKHDTRGDDHSDRVRRLAASELRTGVKISQSMAGNEDVVRTPRSPAFTIEAMIVRLTPRMRRLSPHLQFRGSACDTGWGCFSRFAERPSLRVIEYSYLFLESRTSARRRKSTC